MKKIFKMFILIIILFPFVVSADMGAPVIPEYEGIVIKEGGSDYYDITYNNAKYSIKKVGTLKKDSKIKVIYEENFDNTVYLAYNDEKYNLFYVKASDVIPANDELSYTDSHVGKLDEASSFYVYSDVEVKKGPSYSYETVGKLKKGTKGKYQYTIDDSIYIYVDIDGVKGWIGALDRKVLTKKDMTYVIGKELNTKCGTIPVNTIFVNPYDAPDHDSMKYGDGTTLVEINGCETFINTFHTDNVGVVYGDEGSNYKTIKEIKVYENKEFKKEVGTIPAGVQLEMYASPNYTGPGPTYLQYKDIKGWVDGEEANSKVEWVEMTEEEKEEAKKEQEELEEEKETKEEETKTETTGEKEEKKEEKKEKDSNDVVMICIIVALSLACGSLITLLLVNKKKKDTNEEK